MAHRRGSSRFRGISDSQRRKKVWGPLTAFAVDEDASVSGEQSNTLNFQLSVGATLPGTQSRSIGYVFGVGGADAIQPESTLLRLRGSLQMDKNSIAGDGIETFAFGIGVMEVGAALLASYPNPATPEGSNWDGWMFYRSLNSGVIDAASTFVDVKSMRKIQSGYALVLVSGQSKAPFTVGGNATLGAMSAQFTSRGLFLLP